MMTPGQIVLYGQIIDLPHIEKSLRDEVKDLKSRYKSVFNSLSDKYGNEVLYNSSEIISLDFKLPENAIRFAINSFHHFLQEPRIPFRAGISYISNEEGQTGLNLDNSIAYKLSEICSEGSILLTRDIVNSLKENKEFDFEYVGNVFLKDIKSPVEIYALSSKGFYIPSQNELVPKQKKENSIAVLPLHNTSSDKEIDYISDGIAEEIIDSLSKSKHLFVTARSSSFMFKNKEISIQDISRKLNVNFVLDGSIRKRNDEYRISYQLVDSTTGYNILSESFSSDFDNLYNSEKKISNKIITHFNPNEELSNDTDDFYINPVAYSHYLKGKYLINQWNKDDSNRAIDHFNKALEIVPAYALAYAGLSSVNVHIAINSFGDFKSHLEKAIEYAEHSIDADSSIPDGYVAKAVATFWQGNLYLPNLEKYITTALTISPCNAEIRMFNGMVFLLKGNFKRALSELKLAKQLDPFSNLINLRLGIVQYLNKDYQDAHNTFLSQLKEDSYKTNYLLRLAKCCLFLKHYNKALEYLSNIGKEDSFFGLSYACYLIIYKNLKNEEKFHTYRSIIENQEKTDPSYAYNHAVLNNLKGNKELAIHFLEITLQNPLTVSMFFHYDALWKDLHDHPLFIERIASKYKGTDNQLIKIESETKEFVELKITDFLYAQAQDNYTLIVFKQKKLKTEKILRITLANVEKQLNFKDIVRCHRSYIINSASGFTFHKSENKAFLKNAEWDLFVPVSRSKEKEIKELLHSK